MMEMDIPPELKNQLLRLKIPFNRLLELALKMMAPLLMTGALYVAATFLERQLTPSLTPLLLMVGVIFSAWYFGTFSGLLALSVSTLLYLSIYSESMTSLSETVLIAGAIYLVLGLILTYASLVHHNYVNHLKLRHTHFQKLLHHSPVPLLLLNKKRRISFAGRSIKALLGISSSDCNGRTLSNLFKSPDQAELKAFLDRLYAEPDRALTVEVRSEDGEGSSRWYQFQGRNLLHEPQVQAILLSLRDITQQRQFDNQMRKLLLSEQKARRTAEDAVRFRDEFLSIASHELKTPLTNILLQLQSTLKQTLTQSLADFSGAKLVLSLSTAEEQSRRLGQLIKDLLNVSVVSTGKLKVERKEADVCEFLETTVRRFEEQFDQAGMELKVKLPEKMTAYFDPVRMEQAVGNLLTNALKYGEGKPVEVRLKQVKKGVEIRIKDQGQGIAADKQQLVFERFKRGVNNGLSGGLGVGLFITQQIMLAHGGEVKLKSAPGEGSEFCLYWPNDPVEPRPLATV